MKTKLLLLGCASALLLSGCGPRKTSAEAERAIKNNLRQYHLAGQQYLLESGKPEARHGDLVGDGKFLKLKPANGEDYASLVVSTDTKSLTVTAADGTSVTYAIKDGPVR